MSLKNKLCIEDLIGAAGEVSMEKRANAQSPEEGIEKIAGELEAIGTIIGRALGTEFVKVAASAGGGGDVGSKWRQFADAQLAAQGRDTSVGEAASRVAKAGGVLPGAAGTLNSREKN